jgi:hypothetical protein
LHLGGKFKIDDFRKLSSERGVRITPTTLQWEVDLGADDYQWKCGNKKGRAVSEPCLL